LDNYEIEIVEPPLDPKFIPAPYEEDVLKHGTHDQKTHGSWATGVSSNITLDSMPYEWKPLKGKEPTWGTATAEVAKEAFEEISQSQIATRLWGGELDNIVKEGRFKSLNELPRDSKYGSSASEQYRNARAELENGVWGTPKEGAQPIYGYLDVENPTYQEGVSLYGDVKITFKDNISGRTTVTAGDSLNHKLTPVRLSELRDRRVNADNVMRASRNNAFSEFGRDKKIQVEYVEAQIHGGVKLSDFKSVTLDRFSQVEPSTISTLKNLGIEVTVSNG
jgi:hypothetical protein